MEALMGIPLGRLGELTAHEEDFLSGACPHVSEQRSQIGELLPPIAGHLVEQCALAIYDLVVGKRQNEVFEPGVDKTKSKTVVMESTMNRLLGEVLERIVHPSHVPLEAETQPTHIKRTTYAEPRSGLFGDHQDPRMTGLGLLI